ncbi:MAG TPA: DUF2381 family protein [Myxococcaceae bacterium]|nr:DUF2381 family protein [Myxococcaceae bacterium]
MLQPGTLTLLLLVLGTAARAQPASGPTPRQRSLTVTGNPTEPVPEVHGAQGAGITFHFDGPILEGSVRVDEARVRVVDVGKRSLLVVPLAPPRADQPMEVSVLYADGEPRRAAFVIVAHPSEVDTWIEVTRRAQSQDATCQARLEELRARCGAHSPTGFLRAGLLTSTGIQARAFQAQPASEGSLVVMNGVAYLGQTWVLVEVEFQNDTGQAWAPRGATLTGNDGQPVSVHWVTAEPAEVAPGAKGRVWVETAEVPPAGAGVEFVLEVGGADGRVLRVPQVKLPPRKQEGKR